MSLKSKQNSQKKMDLTFLLLVTALLCNSCFTEAADNPDFAELLKLLADYDDETTKFDSEEELISWLHSTNDSDIIDDQFSEYFGRHEVQIYTGDEFEFNGKEYRLSIDDVSERIHIGDYSLALSILQKFGNSIGRLYIAREFSKDILENITSTFESLKSLRVELSESIYNILPFNESFPMLTELTLHLETDNDYSFISCALPNLGYLNVSVTTESWRREDQIVELIRKNAQIKALEINGFPSLFIKHIHRMLPHLVSLVLHGFNTGNGTLQFNYLKHLGLYGSPSKNDSLGSIQNLLCPQLKYLDFVYLPSDLAAWKTFFANHPNVGDVNVREGDSQNRLTPTESIQLIEMISTLANLTILKVHENNFVSVASVKPFIENHENLCVFHYTTFPDAYDVVLVRDKPESPWQLHAYYYDDRMFVGDYEDFENILEKSRKQLQANATG